MQQQQLYFSIPMLALRLRLHLCSSLNNFQCFMILYDTQTKKQS